MGMDVPYEGVQDYGWVVTRNSPDGSLLRPPAHWFAADGYLARGRSSTPLSDFRGLGLRTPPPRRRGRWPPLHRATHSPTTTPARAPGWHLTPTNGTASSLRGGRSRPRLRASYSADGWAHYTLASGYVFAQWATLHGYVYLADNEACSIPCCP